ncbi:hypothetical protein CEXT_535811 [Caerostris extrusa]|uniref:Uncharacterized protein n=1 Tax=Caerostris extrusa TaxID=172846 RepID=A0AAV4W0G8_CAEEX|nr:hypothetical protein CEXT_535811 [Caerostris extrusa]
MKRIHLLCSIPPRDISTEKWQHPSPAEIRPLEKRPDRTYPRRSFPRGGCRSSPLLIRPLGIGVDSPLSSPQCNLQFRPPAGHLATKSHFYHRRNLVGCPLLEQLGDLVLTLVYFNFRGCYYKNTASLRYVVDGILCCIFSIRISDHLMLESTAFILSPRAVCTDLFPSARWELFAKEEKNLLWSKSFPFDPPRQLWVSKGGGPS